ncbi:MAG: enoyl-CoA hydratase [Pseudomonadota bacterium]
MTDAVTIPKIVDTSATALLSDLADDGVLRLTMSRPPANTLSEAMLGELQQAFDEAAENDAVRVIILASTGDLFCAGHDLKEMEAKRSDDDRGRAYFELILGKCATLMQSIVNHPKPVIAEVDGLATAAGAQLVASCDLAIVSDRSTFCTPGVHIGLFCSTPMVALSRVMHRKHAMEMLLTGETIDASAARENGLVNRVVPRDYLRQVTDKYASTIASKSSYTLKVGKQAFYAQREMPLSEAYEYASRVMTENMLARDAQEGIGAFLDKRDPEWTDS